MTKKTTKVLAGVAVSALAAAAVAAVVRYRQGHKPLDEEHEHLDELEARLGDVETPEKKAPVGRVIDNLQRNQGISVMRLRQWISGLRQGTLSDEQASVAESDFDALEREADQSGA
jgi:hypothetical protein